MLAITERMFLFMADRFLSLFGYYLQKSESEKKTFTLRPSSNISHIDDKFLLLLTLSFQW